MALDDSSIIRSTCIYKISYSTIKDFTNGYPQNYLIINFKSYTNIYKSI